MKIHKVKEYEPSINIRGKVTKDQLSRLDTVTIANVIHSFTLFLKKEDDKNDHVSLRD